MWFFHVDTQVFQHHLLETVAPTWHDFCSIVTWPSLYGAISGLFWCHLAVCPQGVPEQPWGSLQAPPLLRSFLAEIFVPPPAIRWWEAGEKEQGPLLDHSLPSVGGKRPVPCVKLLQTSAAATVAAAPAWEVGCEKTSFCPGNDRRARVRGRTWVWLCLARPSSVLSGT